MTADNDIEAQEEADAGERRARMQAYYKSGQRVSRGAFLKNAQMSGLLNRALDEEKQKQLGLDSESRRKAAEEGEKFDYVDFTFVLCVGAFYDFLSFILNLIPVVGGVASALTVTPIAMINLFIMYSKRGISLRSTKKMLTFGGTSLIEFIPVLNAVPGFMLNVILNYPPPLLDKAMKKAKIK